MQISEHLVRRYQEAHKRKYGEDISAKEAEQCLSNLKDLIRTIRSCRHGK